MTAAADLFQQGQDAFFDDDYDEALEYFTKAIEAEPENVEFILRRCAVHQKLKNLKDALQDATVALECLEKNQGARSLLAKANLQKGIVLHNQGGFVEAQKYLEESKKLNPNEKKLVTWLRKNQEELPKETNIAPVPAIVSSEPVAIPKTSHTRHDWFQNDKYVTIEIFAKNVKQDDISIDFHEKALSVSIKMPTGPDFSLELDPLAYDISPKGSTYKALSTKVEIKMMKKMEGLLWNVLDNTVTESTSYVTKVKTPKDWNKLANDVSQEQENLEGDAALNNLFQKIYKDADEDTKRAMMKSYVESNGTCLSTNWSEVGSKKVETKPPEGMDAKPYNQ